ncbi:hypothetical protein TWF730_008640 [Orbilia blumenaviensis]|uniref:Uncharacterized protein n=1 Tax=Orbilia blumenaviensis TaxID=1796055 RepID=A0AAV9V395_9PEZI
MTFYDKLLGVFHRGPKAKQEKKQKNGHQGDILRQMLQVPPAAVGLALPGVSFKSAQVSSELPTPPPRVVFKDQVSSRSLPTYGQEDLVAIDMVPRPAYPRSFSAGMLHEEQSQIRCHARYETLERRGINVPTVVVGPVRLSALRDWEALGERAEAEVNLPLPGLLSAVGEPGCEFVGNSAYVPATPRFPREEKPRAERGKKKSIRGRMARVFQVKGIQNVFTSNRPRANKVTRPTGNPAGSAGQGFRLWLRDGVDPWADASNPCLHGRDKPGLLRTVHPRPWVTTIVTAATAPKAVPRKNYRDFAREMWFYFPNGFASGAEEYSAFEEWFANRAPQT